MTDTTGQPLGLEAMKAAEETGKDEPGSDAPGVGAVIPGTDPAEMGNPYAGTTDTGTAKESNQELLSRMTAGAVDPPVVSPPAPAAAVGRSNESGQVDSKELQARLDRQEAEISRLQEEASVGRYVIANENLSQKVSDSMRGVTTQPGMDGLGYDEAIKQKLNLPADFIFNQDEAFIPGTQSFLYWEEATDMRVDKKVDEKVSLMRQEEDLRNQGNVVRERFLAAGHSVEDLQELMIWTADGENFSLEKLWMYKNGQLAPTSGAGVSQPAPAKQHIPSIGGMAGAGASPNIPPEVQVAADLLRESDKHRKVW